MEKHTQQNLPHVISQNGIAVSLNKKDFKTVSDLAPANVREAIKEGFPISQIAKVTGMDRIYQQVEFDLIRCLALLNLNLTLSEQQYPFVVRELVDTFANESIQDFQLCFKNGVKGKYGKIYNVDLSVLATWMGMYLEEKYQIIEQQEREEESKKLPDIDYEAFKKRQPQPEKKSTFSEARKLQLEQMQYKAPDKDYLIEMELKREWGKLYHDLYTGKKLKNWISFEDFKKQKHERHKKI